MSGGGRRRHGWSHPVTLGATTTTTLGRRANAGEWAGTQRNGFLCPCPLPGIQASSTPYVLVRVSASGPRMALMRPGTLQRGWLAGRGQRSTKHKPPPRPPAGHPAACTQRHGPSLSAIPRRPPTDVQSDWLRYPVSYQRRQLPACKYAEPALPQIAGQGRAWMTDVRRQLLLPASRAVGKPWNPHTKYKAASPVGRYG